MIKEFIDGKYHYTINNPSKIISKVKLNGVDISKYLTNESKISWYDVTNNNNMTNADGTMVLNVINTKYRLDLVTRPLLQDEVIEFYKTIIDSPKITVEFLNAFTGEWKTIYGYRGDRNIQAMFPYLTQDGFVELYSSISQTIIEL